MADLISMLAAAAGAAAGGGEVDPNFNQTVLLLHGDGTDGAQNNTFLDSSTNNFTITRNGNTTQGTFTPFSLPDGRWSNYFDTSGDNLALPNDSDFAFGTGAYTVEAWVYLNGYTATDMLIFSSATSVGAFLFQASQASPKQGAPRLVGFGAATTLEGSASDVPINEWVHIAIARESTASNETRIFVNGAVVATGTDTNDWTVTTNPSIGNYPSNNPINASINGYVSNLRIVKGRAVYTSAFTPSAGPLGSTSVGQDPPQGTETSLLTCQSNRFVDNSTNNFAITRNGDVKVTPFSPFAPTAAYDASVNGGSGYFDGSGDYLTVPSNAAFGYGTGDFSLEFWAYPLANSDSNRVIFHSDDNFNLELIATTVRFWNGSSNLGGSYNANAWVHVCITRESSTGRMFVDGVLVNNFSLTTNKGTSSVTIAHENSSQYFGGYLSNIRIVKGGIPSAYQTASTTNGTQIFTPQTTPFTGSESLTAGSVSLLLRGENAGIFDNTGKNNLETVGNAQIDTTTKKYGTGSMEFDGAGDFLAVPSQPYMALGSGDFTIEVWLYPTTLGGAGNYHVVLDSRITGTTNTWGLAWNGDNTRLEFFNNNTALVYCSLSTNTWTNIAVVRSSGTVTMYKDGVAQTPTASHTNNLSATLKRIGNSYDDFEYIGLIDDLRITVGVARTISLPTKAYPDL